MRLNFNGDYLKEDNRYSTFPIDFLKAETIIFYKCCIYFLRISPYLRQKSSWKNDVLEFHENDEYCLKTVIRHLKSKKHDFSTLPLHKVIDFLQNLWSG